ncbi:MAG TPA: hypothetical protein PLB62_15485, partial [Candidatus Sumerlaeota bacterium]|nr:hypothetical protein [Candidatus Sumerlaeota bacterium]
SRSAALSVSGWIGSGNIRATSGTSEYPMTEVQEPITALPWLITSEEWDFLKTAVNRAEFEK